MCPSTPDPSPNQEPSSEAYRESSEKSPGAEPPSDLRAAILEEAMDIVKTDGVEELSLREVSRRLGVSHQAPYKHFRSRDHILAELVRRAYASFADHLRSRPLTGEPHEDLEEMGRAYVRYAREHPLEYRLMFGTPLPDPEDHPEMLNEARAAFRLLKEAIADLDGVPSDRVDADALYVWSTVHGLASLLGSHALRTADAVSTRPEEVIPAVLKRIGEGLAPDG
jgi:AcrR family transcriptional regulator